ncbi:oxidoreductase-like domain-containing protein [Pseudoduganella sp. OTU4001]|uniref:oxidoreductase-like domain-containing protein n=1 Tax=Pseudoduganella sp. OTU4001 TaxID=3043854 RepID=UPI00313DE835
MMDPQANAPKPQPPVEPHPDDCCHSGCTWCVFELYHEDLERYRKELAAWESRHPHT